MELARGPHPPSHAPNAQILCARLKILAQPHVAAALPPEDAQAEAAGEGPGDERDAPVWTPNILACRWERRRGQRRLLPRLKANLRAMSLTLFVCSRRWRMGWGGV